MAHEFAIHSMKLMTPFCHAHKTDARFNLNLFGLHFQNPIGLAAGLDKNGEVISFMSHLPFGFIEIGTVTPRAQVGNEKPRLFRYKKEESLRNKMGFNNLGAEKILLNLNKSDRQGKILGVNLGKNKTTPNENAGEDYAYLYEKFAPHADYLVINVSSPNTPGLRDLMRDKNLKEILEKLEPKRIGLKKPLFLKVSPDMALEELVSVVGVVNEYALDGIIATNTAIMKERGEGGVSGKLLAKKAKETRNFLLNEMKNSNSKAELIGVGGISKFSDLMDFWRAGGKLAQIYSAFIFQGPQILFDIERELSFEFKKRGTLNFDEFLESVRK